MTDEYSLGRNGRKAAPVRHYNGSSFGEEKKRRINRIRITRRKDSQNLAYLEGGWRKDLRELLE